MTSRAALNSNMQRRGQGWAAFDHKQRGTQSRGAEHDVDPFPSISGMASSTSTKSLLTNNRATTKSFSSVVNNSLKFSPANNISVAKHPVKLLKEIHKWAGQNLIEDVLAAVDNNVDQASALLKSMASSEESSSLKPNLSVPNSSTAISPFENNNGCLSENVSVERKVFEENHEMFISKQLAAMLVEPEWEEDDVYLSHRKHAIRKMRMASQHSRAASNAFLRGDHVSAQEHSSRAREEWLAAEELNSKASKEILGITNRNNDIWKLDLHGLHASEAVSALKEHLQKIEFHVMMKRSASSEALAKLEGSIPRTPSCESVSDMEVKREVVKKKELPRQRQSILHVITGTGNHSKGQASLPTAIRSFLIENGYHFDDARAGVFAVRPKFRHN